jgi:hypothetical protein
VEVPESDECCRELRYTISYGRKVFIVQAVNVSVIKKISVDQKASAFVPRESNV